MNDNGAVKHDALKVPYHLMSPLALVGLCKVLLFGEQKYASHNWRKGMDWSRVVRALLHHSIEFMAGVRTDAESGLPTIDHIQACAHFLSEYEKTKIGVDDMYTSTLIPGLFKHEEDADVLAEIVERARALRAK